MIKRFLLEAKLWGLIYSMKTRVNKHKSNIQTKAIKLFLLVGISILLITFFFGDHGLYHLYTIKSERKKIQEEIEFLREKRVVLERQKKEDERSKDRKSKIGSGDRSERIRTYNFPQGRVTDHRINFTLHKLEEFMQGEIFDEMIENLNLQAQEEKLKNLN